MPRVTPRHQPAGRTVRGPAGWTCAASVVLIALLAGCAHPVHGQPDGQVSICGKTVHTGAMQPIVERLHPDPPAQSQPAASVLPSPIAVAHYSQVRYARLTDSCTAGAIVTVQPPGNAQLAITFPASDGRPAAIGLLVKAPVVIRAWRGGHDLGSLSLD